MQPTPPTDLANAAEAVARYGEFGDRWLAAMWDMDPLADAVVADPGSAAAVRTALTDGLAAVTDPTASVQELFAFLDDEPAWVDHAAMDRAADVLSRYSAELGIVLGSASLLRGAINQLAGMPLVITGRYTTYPAMRSVEVGEWLDRVLTPGGMRRDGEGLAYTVRVRLIHAHVRRAMAKSGKWDDAAWGAPIPQPYMAFTMSEFSHIAVEAMERIGARFTPAELDDIYHLWRYVGHVIGMDDWLNPATEADHIRIEELYRLTSPGPNDEDREFVAALTEEYLVPELALTMKLPADRAERAARRTVYALQRIFLGDEDADLLGIPQTRLTSVVKRLGPVMAGAGRLRITLSGGPAAASARGYRVRRAELDRMRKKYAMTHRMVDEAPGSPVGAAH